MKFLQRIGKSLMLPVAVLPICGILMGIGYWMCPASMQGQEITGIVPVIGYILVKAGGAIIDNMSWLFVIGVSVGMSDDNHGASCLAGGVSYLVITTLLSPSLMSVVVPGLVSNEIFSLAFSKIQNPFIAILAGTLGAFCYNRYKETSLPKYFSFFSGRRFVIIVSTLFSIGASAVLALIWPLAFFGLTKAGNWILSLGGIGVGVYAFLNRLLIPLGLHHALNNVFWFDTIGIGDLTSFWSGMTSGEAGWSVGMYMSGFFPCMMFGIPGAALAMIRYAKDRKKAVGILLSAAVCAFVCGVTEPFEFSFMFAAFPLYVIYSLLYGIFAAVTYYTGFRAGFSFSAGATDLLFSASLPAANATWQIIPLGICAFAVFYVAFAFMIKKFGFQTPGNEDNDGDLSVAGGISVNSGDKVSDNSEAEFLEEADEYTRMAGMILSALGGSGNLTGIDCCATRLRLDVCDTSVINHSAIKSAGALASKNTGKNTCQIVIGVTVQQVCDALKKLASGEVKVRRNDAANSENYSEYIFIERGERLPLNSVKGFEIVIRDEKGIHARPAGELVSVAKQFECSLCITYQKRTSSLKSITGVMSLGITSGAKVKIQAEGPDENEALKAIKQAFEDLSLN